MMRALLLSLVALCAWTAPASAQIALVQESAAYIAGTGTPLTAEITFPEAVTEGALVFCHVGQSGTGTRTYVVDGAIQDAAEWVKVVDIGDTGFGPEIWVTVDHPGGTETITITHGQSSGNFAASCSEFTWPTDEVHVVDFATYEDPGATDDHFSADDSGVSGSGLLLGISSGVLSGAATSTAAGMGWAKTPDFASTGRITQFQVFADGVSGERGAWTSAGTDRTGFSVIVLLAPEESASTTPRCCGYLLRGWIP